MFPTEGLVEDLVFVSFLRFLCWRQEGCFIMKFNRMLCCVPASSRISSAYLLQSRSGPDGSLKRQTREKTIQPTMPWRNGARLDTYLVDSRGYRNKKLQKRKLQTAGCEKLILHEMAAQSHCASTWGESVSKPWMRLLYSNLSTLM